MSVRTALKRLRNPYYTVLAMPEREEHEKAVWPLRERYGTVLRVAVLPRSDALLKRYGPNDGRLYLIRPDGYVASKAPAADPAGIERHLQGVLGP